MLDTLCTELLEHIAAFLDGSDLSSLRLVCRSLRETTTAAFGRAWLGIVETNLSEEGLRKLETIVGHDISGNALHTLRIARAYTHVNSTLSGERIWPRQESSNLDLSSAVVRNFQDIVPRFDNCTTFEVCERPGNHREDNTVTTGFSPADALRLVLSIMTTGIPPIQILHIFINVWPRYKDAKQLLPITINSTMLPSLQDLHIDWHIGDEMVEQVAELITAAIRLKRLHLNFGTSTNTTRVFHRLAAVPTLPLITHLRLGHIMSVSYKALVNMIFRFQESLRSLHIGSVTLNSGDWGSLFRELSRHGFSYLESIALCFLRATQPPNYSNTGTAYFCPLRLKQKKLEECGGIFEFVLAPDRKKWRVSCLRYTGPRTGMALTLKALADDSHYLISRITRSPSPGLPNMKTFTGDCIGRVIPRFDQMKIWDNTVTV